ncbi:histidine N-acetyltransferase-like [Ascaphus truei]|uniref:histidine N-acetyltransferase-like n=1 Tax=Ascaphus truei TaxID=8439 RepID=UPI003F590F72
MSIPRLPEVCVLPAGEGDFEEVMSISGGIYKGMDYLPARYHRWVRDPQRKMFLAKSEGRVVGFESFLLVDGGVTAVVEGLRVAPWVRSQGVARVIQRFCVDTLRSAHPEVTRVRLSRSENPPAAMLEKYQLVHSKAVLSVVLPPSQLWETVELLQTRVLSAEGRSPPDPSILEPPDVLSLFEGQPAAEGLLPGGLLIQGWLPVTPHRGNLDLLLGRGLLWLYSHPCDVMGACDVTDNSNTNIRQAPNKPGDLTAPSPPSALPSPGFLSLGTPLFPVPLEGGVHRLDIDLFGTDPVCAGSHILHQLRRGVWAAPAGAGIVCIMYAEESLRGEIARLCQGLAPFHLVREQLVLEMEI